MSQAVKRISTSSLNWQKLLDSLTPELGVELNRLKGQNTQFSSIVNQLPSDLPKFDFAALKKKLPDQAALLDSLQKQYETISIPYGKISDELNKEISKWIEYNEARQKLQALKAVDGAEEAKKIEDKWTKAPPIEQFTRDHWPQFFSKLPEFYDLRVDERFPDPTGLNLNSYPYLKQRFSDYKILPRPDAEHH